MSDRRAARAVRGAGILFFSALLLLPAAGSVVAAEPSASPGPPFPDPVPGRTVYDTAGILEPGTISSITLVSDQVAELTGAPLVIYTQRVEDPGPEATAGRAQELLAQWQGVWPGLGSGIVLLVEQDPTGATAELAYAASDDFLAAVPQSVLDAAQVDSIRPVLEQTDVNVATMVAAAEVLYELTDGPSAVPGQPGAPAGAPPPGPPFPDPEPDRAVYDFAGVFGPETIAAVEATIDRIEERTGAEVVVYTQVVDFPTASETEAHAIALIDQWGVGRRGFDDGLAIFFDFEPSRSGGQVQLYAGPGFRTTFLSNEERQQIFEQDMLPYLRVDDWDAAIVAAMDRIDAAATPEHAARLELGRQVNAVVGLVGAPLVLAGLLGWAFFHWRRYGKDPVYLDSPSIYVPAPPPGLTAASGALVMDGRTSRRALTTAMLDLASRGLIAFREETGLLGFGRKVGVELDPSADDDVVAAQRARNARRPIGPAEQLALRRLQPLGDEGYIEPDELLKFGTAVDDFDTALERHVVGQGWFAEAPSAAMRRWVVRGVLAVVVGGALVWAAFVIPMSGLTLVGGAAIIAGALLFITSRTMPAVTMEGAMIRAQLAAYRRTLHKTMEQARSMDQVVAEAGLDWLDTPDQAVVWGTALGLQHDIETVLERSLDDVQRGRAPSSGTYFPIWYRSSGGGGVAGGGGGIFSTSGVPNIGGMMAALGTIGNSPASSGSGGGGGFSGGSSGGGGGGAGGGF